MRASLIGALVFSSLVLLLSSCGSSSSSTSSVDFEKLYPNFYATFSSSLEKVPRVSMFF